MQEPNRPLEVHCHAGQSFPEYRTLNPFICGTICWLHPVGNGFTKSTENCRVAKLRNQIKPDAHKVTNALKCEPQADVQKRLTGGAQSCSIQEECHTSITGTFIDFVHWTAILAHGGMPEWKVLLQYIIMEGTSACQIKRKKKDAI